MSNTHSEQQVGRGAWDHILTGTPAPHEQQTGQPPWQTSNARSVPVYQRASQEWEALTVYVGSNTGGLDPVKLVDRQNGRDWVIISVPATGPSGNATPCGVYIAARDAPLQAAGGPLGFFIPIGQSLTLTIEGSVWAVAAIAGATTFCCVASGYNLDSTKSYN